MEHRQPPTPDATRTPPSPFVELDNELDNEYNDDNNDKDKDNDTYESYNTTPFDHSDVEDDDGDYESSGVESDNNDNNNNLNDYKANLTLGASLTTLITQNPRPYPGLYRKSNNKLQEQSAPLVLDPLFTTDITTPESDYKKHKKDEDYCWIFEISSTSWAAAGISLVAISFGAGYAFGRRSLRVA